MLLQTDLKKIKLVADEKEGENDLFRMFLKGHDSEQTDKIVHRLNEEISPRVDCTRCGNCCKSLVTVTTSEIGPLAEHLQISPARFKEKFIDESDLGQMMINRIPCHFLNDTVCTVYQFRFIECREFPHLHKPHFTRRLSGTLKYYPVCPIIFNLVEGLKEETGFKTFLAECQGDA